MNAWTVAPDPNTDEPTLWHGDRSVVRRSDLRRIAPIAEADVLFDTLTAVLAPDEATVERLAEASHDAYEAAAVEAGWETQQRSRKPWADVPEANKATVRVTIRAVLAALAGTAAPHERDGEVGE